MLAISWRKQEEKKGWERGEGTSQPPFVAARESEKVPCAWNPIRVLFLRIKGEQILARQLRDSATNTQKSKGRLFERRHTRCTWSMQRTKAGVSGNVHVPNPLPSMCKPAVTPAGWHVCLFVGGLPEAAGLCFAYTQGEKGRAWEFTLHPQDQPSTYGISPSAPFALTEMAWRCGHLSL